MIGKVGALCLAAVVALLLAGCVPPEPVDELAKDYDPELTLMGRIQEAGELSVGLPESPAHPSRFKRRTPVQGFTEGLATELAEVLGVEVATTVASDDELFELVEQGDLDIAFPLTAVTEKRVRRNSFSDPYYVAHQRFLVVNPAPDLSPDLSLDGIGPATRLCMVIDPDTAFDLATADTPAPVVAVTDPNSCFKKRWSEIVTAPDLDLIDISEGLQVTCSRTPKASCPDMSIVGEQLTTEGYAALLAPDPPWIEFVKRVFGEAESTGEWTRLYNEWLAPHLQDPDPTPPAMTLEEAAAIFPVEG